MFPTHLGDYVKTVEGTALTTQAGDSLAAVTSSAIDRLGYEVALINLQGTVTNQQDTKDVQVTYTVQVLEATELGGSYTQYGSDQTVTLDVSTTGITDVTETIVNELNVNLRGAKRYIKIKITPSDTGNDSLVASDTTVTGSTVVLGGAETKPAS